MEEKVRVILGGGAVGGPSYSKILLLLGQDGFGRYFQLAPEEQVLAVIPLALAAGEFSISIPVTRKSPDEDSYEVSGRIMEIVREYLEAYPLLSIELHVDYDLELWDALRLQLQPIN